jgi:hypothetical protein
VALEHIPESNNRLRLQVVRDILDCANRDPEFLKTVITGDETWVYGYDPETKAQSSQWKHSSSPRLQKSTMGAKHSQGAAVFFDYRGIVHHSYAPEGQTINK